MAFSKLFLLVFDKRSDPRLHFNDKMLLFELKIYFLSAKGFSSRQSLQVFVCLLTLCKEALYVIANIIYLFYFLSLDMILIMILLASCL